MRRADVEVVLLFWLLYLLTLEHSQFSRWFELWFGGGDVPSAVNWRLDILARTADVGLLLNLEQVHIVLSNLILVISWHLF